jgi:hypothetical protein
MPPDRVGMTGEPTDEQIAAFKQRCDDRRAQRGKPLHIDDPTVYRILDGLLAHRPRREELDDAPAP